MAGSLEARVARMDERQLAQGETLKDILIEMRAASESRKRVYETQEKIEKEMIHLNHRLETVEQKVDRVTPTSEEYERVRDRVVFAGRLGRWLWGTGKVLLSAAAGATAYWYAMTGRPPP